MEEIRFLQSNTMHYYKRGAASGNTLNFNNDVITFNQNGTGTYVIDLLTPPLTLTWGVEDDEVTIVINYTIPLTVYWENLSFEDSFLKYTEYYTASTGVQTLSAGHRTPL